MWGVKNGIAMLSICITEEEEEEVAMGFENMVFVREGVHTAVSVSQKIANSDRLPVIAGGPSAGWLVIESLFRTSLVAKDEEHGHEPILDKKADLVEVKATTINRNSVSLRVVLATRDLATRCKRTICENAISPNLSSSTQIQVSVTGSEDDALQNAEFEGGPSLPRIVKEDAARAAEMGQSLKFGYYSRD
ncbi:hypothetical protein DL95DRAFT_500004 [Leptodontidium sp. 2 PMI_412]|nr:hypothetical protein DL95DRAFT_500004 [Leptodontidium sp. 2 PMI_412]